MAAVIEDSPRRCPFCGKRMLMEIGQDGALGDYEMQAVHQCWNCDYREIDHEWTRPIPSTVGLTLAQIRDRVRAGIEVPMVYDRTPVTVEQALQDSRDRAALCAEPGPVAGTTEEAA